MVRSVVGLFGELNLYDDGSGVSDQFCVRKMWQRHSFFRRLRRKARADLPLTDPLVVWPHFLDCEADLVDGEDVL